MHYWLHCAQVQEEYAFLSLLADFFDVLWLLSFFPRCWYRKIKLPRRKENPSETFNLALFRRNTFIIRSFRMITHLSLRRNWLCLRPSGADSRPHRRRQMRVGEGRWIRFVTCHFRANLLPGFVRWHRDRRRGHRCRALASWMPQNEHSRRVHRRRTMAPNRFDDDQPGAAKRDIWYHYSNERVVWRIWRLTCNTS